MKRTLLLLAAALFVLPHTVQAQDAWINEFHYDNDGTDVGEFIEVVVENASQYAPLSDFEVVLYNGANGEPYDTKPLSDFATDDVKWSDTFSFFTFEFPSNGIQNGSPDGIALCYKGVLVEEQFLSYEGSLEAVDGCAAGVSSVDIGVNETSDTPDGYSLQLKGKKKSSYEEFSWEGPIEETPGFPNMNQSLKPSRGGNASCPMGTELLAKYEWDDTGEYVFEGDSSDPNDVIDFTGDAISADWTWTSAGDDEGVAAVVVKGGTANTVVFSPSVTSGTITEDELAGAISNVQFCVTPGDCPQSYVVSDDITQQPSGSTPGQVTVIFKNDSDGIEQVDFIDENGSLFLENLVVSTPPDGFAANDSEGLSWSYTGGGNAPQQVTFVLEQADLSEMYFRYFARITVTCGSTFIDPPGVFKMIPDQFALKGSYPNPSTGAMTIQFDLDEPSDVRLVVYDVMGRKVATLVDRPMQTGSHDVRWHGRSSTGQPVASGLYFYRFEAGSQVRTERITIVR